MTILLPLPKRSWNLFFVSSILYSGEINKKLFESPEVRDYSHSMSWYTRVAVVLFTSLVLASPPGQCCRLIPLTSSSKPPVNRSCCHARQESAPRITPKSRERHPAKCCCQRDVGLPEKSSLADGSICNFQPITLEHERILPVLELAAGVRAHLSPPAVAIRPQIRLCVWRC